MSVNFNCVNNTSFKGKWEKTNNGAPYYKTNNGLIAGSCLAILPILSSAKHFSNGKNQRGIHSLMLAGLYAGCGAMYDMIRNKNAAKSAETVQHVGCGTAMLQDDRIELSRGGRPYYNSNVGFKYGALLGAIAGFVNIFSSNLLNKNIFKNSKHLALKLSNIAIISVLGGWMMGMLSDKITNNNARRHA